MEMRNGYVLILGIVLLIIMLFVKRKKNTEFESGKKIATSFGMDQDYIKKRIRLYRWLSGCLLLACGAAFVACTVLLARPCKTSYVSKKEYCRDIMLCLDISTSVDEMNAHMIKELKDCVREMEGERFAILIFNTSPVLLVPFTDDYEYVIEVLDQVERALEARLGYDEKGIVSDDYFVLDSFIMEGTLEGAEERGSSMIGDGLASTVTNFPHDSEEKRTKICIFSTDNDLQGKPYFTLEEAGKLCEEHNITVFGLGTKEMYTDKREEMERVIEATGGTFYLEGTDSMKTIVQDIEKQGKNLVSGKKEKRVEDRIALPFVLLVFSVSSVIVLTKITKR